MKVEVTQLLNIYKKNPISLDFKYSTSYTETERIVFTTRPMTNSQNSCNFHSADDDPFWSNAIATASHCNGLKLAN